MTKRGFAEMSLEQQRKRLITGLGGIAAQTGDEVTVVFDGAERVHGLPPAPRGVRVLFSRKGDTADELIRQLVRAEPAGPPAGGGLVGPRGRRRGTPARRLPDGRRLPAAPPHPLLTSASAVLSYPLPSVTVTDGGRPATSLPLVVADSRRAEEEP